ncbi:unnamed protein product [Linum tenue]|uniref:Uncharacterized protein n=1 Tax=Linum tenue TaxID=586396 RepID=A0AAV0J4A4_9ROSI|nr:unnamed protein product [Linum tenue]
MRNSGAKTKRWWVRRFRRPLPRCRHPRQPRVGV